ncbi:phage head closure protein [Sphingobium mellinum]|uniref:phage head closure protein n=1 Tax=Sphingobium mellinum TaxID=1387166 RepID=UPI0030EDC9FA
MAANLLRAGRLDKRVTILSRADQIDPVFRSAVVAWVPLATVWAQVTDILPSRSDKIADGISITNRPCRVRMRYRADIDSGMRLSINGRIYSIVGGPAEMGRRQGLELVAEELSTEGQEP